MRVFLYSLVVLGVSGFCYGQDGTMVRSYTGYNTNIMTNCDQGKCQTEANYMASKNITGHVWGTIGNFEGVGYGSSPNCKTCTPSNPNMRLTGDASARGSNGMWYRVRSWR